MSEGRDVMLQANEKGEEAVRDRLDITDIARGKVVVRERRDVTYSARGKAS